MKWAKLVVAASLLASAGAAVADDSMSADELKAYVVGKSYTGVNPSSGEEIATVIYNADGSSVLSFPDGREEPGSYRLDGDAYCTRYAAFRDNSENCFRLVALGDGRAQAYYTDGRTALILKPAE
ncbi:MAG: hypothetical protein AAGD34_14490 [Pseudomonadota bacterium]